MATAPASDDSDISPTIRHQSENAMTVSLPRSQPARSGPSPVVAAVVGLVVGLTVIVLTTVGISFLGLAIAFPIAVPVAEAYHLPVKAADAALASQLAGFWWVFLGLAGATFVAAGVAVVKLIAFLSPSPGV
jgi:hypothetical protein